MNKKIVLVIAVLSLLIVWLSGCVGNVPVKKVSNEYFEFHYIELDGWTTNPEAGYESKPGAIEELGGDKIALALVNKTESNQGAIIIAYQSLDADAERDLSERIEKTQDMYALGLGGEVEETEIVYKNHRPWASFKLNVKDYRYLIMQTYCGQSFVQATLVAPKENFEKTLSKLTEIIDTFYCKVEIVPSEDYLEGAAK